MDIAPQPPDPCKTSLFIAGADTIADAVATLLALDEPCGSCISSSPPGIATLHPQNQALAFLVGPLGKNSQPGRVVTPPSRVRMIVPRPGELIFIDLANRGSRLGKVAYPRSLFDSELLFACIDVERLTGADPDVAIGLWRHFVWNWARIGKFLGEEGAGLIAEMALGITARRYYLTASTDQFKLALSTPDPIIAELAGRGIRQMMPGRRHDHTRTPWEASIVQRSAELGLGIQSPDRIELHTRWANPDSDSAPFTSYVEHFADLLSITM